MSESKPWYYSKTIWATLVSVAAALAALLGIPIDQVTRSELTDGALQLVTAIAGLFAILGRVTASTRISGSI